MSPEFLITSLIVVASPGTGTLVTVAAGLAHGPRAAVVAALGCTLGIVPHLLAAITGLAALLHASAWGFGLVKWAGVAYLLYMAWSALQQRGLLTVEPEGVRRSDAATIRHAVMVNLLNPKLSIFFVAFLPQFIAAAEPEPLMRMVSLSLAFMAMTFVVFVSYGVFAAAVRTRVLSRPQVLRWIYRGFAGAFVSLGLKLALTQR